MRMVPAVRLPAVELEPPEPVSKVGPEENSGGLEVDEDTVHGRAVERTRRERRDHLAVAHRCAGAR